MPIRIPLSKGFFAIVDDEDASRVHAIGAWHVNLQGDRKYAMHKGILLHRFILGAQLGQVVHHVNHNGLDCRRCNLVITTKSLNNCHRPARHDGPKGCYFDAANNRWKVECRVNGERRFRSCRTLDEAAQAYNVLAAEMQGQFAYLNGRTIT